MYFIRPVKREDLNSLMALANKAGDGLTTLPPDAELLGKRIDASIASFAADLSAPNDEYYFLVMEHAETGDVVGTSAIFSSVGGTQPFYNFATLNLTQLSNDPVKRVETKVLTLANDYTGATELGTLFLDADHRKPGVGRFLSRSRYMLIATAPKRFSETVMGELRGYVDENGRQPVWEAIGRHFFQMDFAEADRINGLGNSQFIADLMPKYPIYTCLLPQDAQEAIGQPHPSSAPAMRLLEKEGFRFRGAVDIFDGGPCLEANRDQIKSVRGARHAKALITDTAENEGEPMMIAHPELARFGVVHCKGVMIAEDQLAVCSEAADALKISDGDGVMFIPDVLED